MPAKPAVSSAKPIGLSAGSIQIYGPGTGGKKYTLATMMQSSRDSSFAAFMRLPGNANVLHGFQGQNSAKHVVLAATSR